MSAGLCVLDVKRKKIIVLKRKIPYDGSVPDDSGRFVEQISIPRGGALDNENLFRCAKREFFEETRFKLKSMEYLDETFNLYWCDPQSKKWEYTIFFAVASLKSKNIMKVRSLYTTSLFTPTIMKITDYTSSITNILKLYGDNNYIEFTNFILKLAETN